MEEMSRPITVEDILEAAELIRQRRSKIWPRIKCDVCAFNGKCRLQDMWRKATGKDQPGICELGYKEDTNGHQTD